MSNADTLLNRSIQVEVERVAKNYDFSAGTEISMLCESENKIFLINDPKRPCKYVARVNSGRTSYHNMTMIESEMAWLRGIRKDTDVVVPDVLAANDGKDVHQLELPESDTTRYMVVYSFLPGTEPPQENLISGFERLGEITAKINQHSRSWQVPQGFDRPHWLPDTILDDCFNWGHWKNGVDVEGETLSLLRRVETTVLHHALDLPKDSENFGLIHADLRLANILVDGQVTAIIDFDDCGFGWYIYELAAALSFLEERSDLNRLIESWHVGYRRISDISSELIEKFPTFLMLRRLKLLGWVGYQQKNLDFARSIGPSFTADTCRLALDYLKHHE